MTTSLDLIWYTVLEQELAGGEGGGEEEEGEEVEEGKEMEEMEEES